MEEETNNCSKNKIITIIFVTVIVVLLFSYIILKTIKQNNSELTAIESKNIQNRNQEYIEKNESQEINFMEYNMTNIIVYDHTYFNSLKMFNIFKRKFFNITYFNYIYSEKYQKVKLVYHIGIYDENKELIEPSDFPLYDKLTLFCFMDVKKPRTTIYSLPQIVQNKYFECIEFFDLKESVNFGIYFSRQSSLIYLSLHLYLNKYINYNSPNNINDDIFDNEFVETKYEMISKKVNDPINKDKYKLKKYYMKPPICDLKRNAIGDDDGWVFKNLYNNYFCYCIGKHCIKSPIKQKCKFNLYKNIIDNNRNLYPKTHYIFVDFIFKGLPSDDTFLVFEEMYKRNMSVHYITEKKEIYKQYCNDTKKCETIIPINYYSYYKYGNFLEKYLTLMLKVKAVISCKESSYHYISYIFYKIEYITYIAVGHGVDLFKDYLFDKNRIYGSRINNKILIPPSPILVDIPIKHGWTEENIIKINLPRWDRYSNVAHYFPGDINSNSILVMFTWRFTRWWFGYRDLSREYHKNVINILGDKKLNDALTKKNMTLYFSVHRLVDRRIINKYDEIINNNTHLEYVKQNRLSECLAKTQLVLSDFSSIIFDLMSRGKPFVIYVPDAEDPDINKIYTNDYVRLINNMNLDKIKFKNKCKSIEETVNKIVNYINNDFKLEPDLKKFYDSFNFKITNNSNEFIDYLINL